MVRIRYILVYSLAAVVGIISFGQGCGPGFKVANLPVPTDSFSPPVLDGKALYDSNCASCHGPVETSQKRDITIQRLQFALDNIPQMQALRGKFNPQQLNEIVKTLNGEVVYATCKVPDDVGRVAIHRLNNTEFDNTIRDLLGVNKKFSLELNFPLDEIGISFSNTASVLQTTQSRLEKTLYAAEQAIDLAFANATMKARLLSCTNLADANCRRTVIKAFAERAFRRPVTDQEVNHFLSIGDKFINEGGETAVKTAMTGVLVSPHFLFRRPEHPQPDNPGVAKTLTAFELASRLSYFIWSSMPDDQLFESAKSGKLLQDSELEAQVKRMLKDPKASALVDNFAYEWLRLAKVEKAAPNSELYPQFTDEVRADMITETKLLLTEIFKNDKSFMDLVAADYTFINDRLAQIYGINGVSGSDFRKVSLQGTERTGILGHGSILSITAGTKKGAVIKRGLFVMDNILCASPPPPPPDVTVEEPEIPPGSTEREVLEIHRASERCASCHAQMDPIGFALENFDAIGQFSTTRDNLPIDSSGSFPDGRTFNGPRGLADILKADKRLNICISQKMFTYALGRQPTPADGCTINRIGLEHIALDKPASQAIIELVKSAPFRQHRGDGGQDELEVQ